MTPPEPRGAVTPVARLSPVGKLRVLVVGAGVETVVRLAKPGLVWFVTVRVPVTATALDGTPATPLTASERGEPEVKAPARPVLTRVSRIRAGARLTYVAPETDPEGVTGGGGA